MFLVTLSLYKFIAPINDSGSSYNFNDFDSYVK